MNFYLSIEWGPRHQFSDWASQFLAPTLIIAWELN